jgi:RNA polymerase sigma-70 factor, ECF subfamily
MEMDEFRILYETHYNALCGAAYRILLDKDSSREVVQNIFFELWETGKWQTIESPKAYLFVSVYNRSITEFQKRKRFANAAMIVDKGVNDRDHLEENELQKIIVEAVNELPEQCKRIFILSREEELTYGQIAKDLNLSVKTVERQMGIALRKLREYLKIHWSG